MSLNERRRSKLMLGKLPDDFLRLEPSNDAPEARGGSVGSSENQHQIATDEQAAMALQQQYFNGYGSTAASSNIRGRLDVTLTEAKLVKNYGVTRMDPYARLRVGHHIYETKTIYNGARTPRFQKMFHTFLPHGVDVVNIEIYDECAFTNDERIAWCIHPIPKTVFDGETVEELVNLNGKQGEGKEGTIGVVFSFTPLPPTSAMYQVPHAAPGVITVPPGSTATIVPNGGQTAAITVPAPPPTSQQPTAITEDDLAQLEEMFPNVDREVIRTILEDQRGNKDLAINVLLQMNTV